MGYMYVYVAAGLFVALLARHARATAYKIQLYMKSLLFLFFTSDTRYKLTDIPDPATLDTTRGKKNLLSSPFLSSLLHLFSTDFPCLTG